MSQNKSRMTFLTNVRPQWRNSNSYTYIFHLKCCVCPSIVRVYTKYDFAYTEAM